MDLVLLILVLVFRKQKDVMHKYTAINVLSIIGFVLCLFIYSSIGPATLVSMGVYLLTLILGLSAENREV